MITIDNFKLPTSYNNKLSKVPKLTFGKDLNGLSQDVFVRNDTKFVEGKYAKPQHIKTYLEFYKSDSSSFKPFVISPNSRIYKLGNKNDSVIVKQKHSVDGIEDGVIKRISSEFDNEFFILSLLSKSFKNRLELVGAIEKNGTIDSIAIKYFDGQMLDANLENLTPKVLKQVHEDLLHLDKLKILHRDLTISNILVDKNFNSKIVDYGAARTFKQINYLNNQDIVKYKQPSFLSLSNIYNFEENALFVYIEQLKSKGGKYIELANDIFLKHLELKSDFYKKHSLISIKQNDDLEGHYQNDQILSDAYSLLKDKKVTSEIKKAIIEIELLRIKMNHAQKRVRLYNDNTLKNPVTAMYWNLLEGVYTKSLFMKTNDYSKKYDDLRLKKYFDLQNRIAIFHSNEIFKKEYKRHSQEMNDFLLTDSVENIDTILKEDVLLQKVDSNGEWTGPCLSIYKMIDNKNEN